MDSNKGKTIKIGNTSISITGLIVIICVLLFIIVFIVSGASGGSSSSTNKCKSCGRVFEAGDSAGNYRCIARTGMCNNCYNNYQWAQDALGN